MKFLQRFIAFWIDFIIGDAWEVAAGIALALGAIAAVLHWWGGRQALGFALVGAVLFVTWIALLRATAADRGAHRWGRQAER